jgi:hypothetical protein
LRVPKSSLRVAAPAAARDLEGMNILMRRVSSTLGLAIALAVALVPTNSAAQTVSSSGLLALGATGIALRPDAALIAVTLRNRSRLAASAVQIDTIGLGTARLTRDVPIAVGTIAADGDGVVRATLTRGNLRPGITYAVTVGAQARFGRAAARNFVLRGTILIPPAAPGSADARSASAPARKTAGAPYPHQTPNFDERENGPRWVVPTDPSAKPARATQSPTKQQRAPRGDPGGITFTTNVTTGINSSKTAEPSGATGNGVVFMTSNWYAAYSITGGSSFTQLDPTTIFPNDAIGYCCDQIVQYVPSIDRFVWLLQGNGMRLATASPAQIKSSGGKAWTYWNLPPTLFGEPSGAGYDYPDLAVGDKDLYMSWDACWPGNPKGCNQGREIVRASLSDIKTGGTLNMGYTTPSDSGLAWGSHLSQDTGDEIFWAGHNSNASIRVFSWPESSGSYSWRDVGLAAWANTGITSATPDGNDWMKFLSGFPGNAVIGATRAKDGLWLAWSAGTNKNFPQPHVEMITVDPGNDDNLIRQVQIWNGSYAYGYPALATNICSDEVGLSLEYGGGGNYENHVVGFWGDFVAYITTDSSVGTTRFGDYVTIRQHATSKPDSAYFDAFGYGLDSGKITTDTHYVLFGRTKCVK